MTLKGLATGIGSLPYTDADKALDLVFKHCPEIPFWPQLPKRCANEGMIAQFIQNLPCLKLGKDGLFFNPQDKEKELEVFYDRLIQQDLDYFKISPDYASGLYGFYQRLEDTAFSGLKDISFIKCHITGPFTFAASINDEKGAALLHDEVFMQVILKGLTMKALWQVSLFKKFNKKIIVFLDEPYLGCFGSAFTPINREQVVNSLSEFTSAVKSEDVLIGVHCCGNTDWSIFTDVLNIDIINFDAVTFLDRLILYSEDLKKFFNKGGILCWGIVPTQEFSGKETPGLLAGKINAGIEALANKGVDRELLIRNMLVSPACGLGMLSTDKSEKILEILSKTSSFIKKSF